MTVTVPKYVSLGELAKIYGIHRQSLYARPNLPGEVRIGRRRLVCVEEFDAAVRAGDVGNIPTVAA